MQPSDHHQTTTKHSRSLDNTSNVVYSTQQHQMAKLGSRVEGLVTFSSADNGPLIA